MSESFLTAGFLSLSGGLQDAYTYMSRGKVFANAQTGNIVLLSQSIGSGDWPLAIHYLVPLLSFALGVAAAELIRQTFQNIRKVHWRQLVLIIEIFLLFFVGFMPDRWNLMANAMVSFSCAMQVQAFRKVNGYGFASTMCIGNMRSAMESVCLSDHEEPQDPGESRLLLRYYPPLRPRSGARRICSSRFRHAHHLVLLPVAARQLLADVHPGRN